MRISDWSSDVCSSDLLAMLIRGSRPKVDMTDHIRLSGDGTGATDMMSQLGGAGGKPRLVKHDDKQPSGSCEIAVVDAEGNWCQFMDTLQGSGIPGQVDRKSTRLNYSH